MKGKQLSTWLSDALDRIDSLTPEEFQRSFQGYTNDELSEYEKNSFSTDFNMLNAFLQANDTYSPDYVLYHPEAALPFISERMFRTVFNQKSTSIVDTDTFDETDNFLNNVRIRVIHGQGSISTYSKYEHKPANNEVLKTLDDIETESFTYTCNGISCTKGTDEVLSFTDGIDLKITKEQAISLRNILNELNLDDDNV